MDTSAEYVNIIKCMMYKNANGLFNHACKGTENVTNQGP